jgi:hypothetical protein
MNIEGIKVSESEKMHCDTQTGYLLQMEHQQMTDHEHPTTPHHSRSMDHSGHEDMAMDECSSMDQHGGHSMMVV